MIPSCRFCASVLTAPDVSEHAEDWRCYQCGRRFRPVISTPARLAYLESENERLSAELTAARRAQGTTKMNADPNTSPIPGLYLT